MHICTLSSVLQKHQPTAQSAKAVLFLGAVYLLDVAGITCCRWDLLGSRDRISDLPLQGPCRLVVTKSPGTWEWDFISGCRAADASCQPA